MPNVKEKSDSLGESHEPPSHATSSPPFNDPFGFDSIGPDASLTVKDTSTWDAFGQPTSTKNDVFGGMSAQANKNGETEAFQADFGEMNAPAAVLSPAQSAPTKSDVFGGISAQANNNGGTEAFQADFGAMNAPTAVPPPATASFEADFHNFSPQLQQQQQPQATMVSLPPPSNQMMRPQMQQPQMQEQQQSSFQSNQNSMQSLQIPMQQQLQQQQPPSQVQGGFANFPQIEHSQQQPLQQQIVQNHPQEGSANFSSMPQPPQQSPNSSQMQLPGVGSQLQSPAQLQPTQLNSQPPQHHQSNFSTEQPATFANFSSVPPPQQQHQNHVMPELPLKLPTAQDFGQGASNMQFLGEEGTISQPLQKQPIPPSTAPPPPPPHQSSEAPMPQKGAAGMMESIVVEVKNESNDASNNKSNEAGATKSNNKTTAPSSAQPQDERNEKKETLNPNAFRPMDTVKQNTFDDAFSGLSLEPTPSTYITEGASGYAAQPKQLSKPHNKDTKLDIPYTAPYREGQQLIYSNSEESCLVTVTKVHFDEDLNPYYTVDLRGRTKEADNVSLSLPPESMSNNTSILLQETVSMLQNLEPQQLVQIQEFVASIVSPSKQQFQDYPQPLMTQSVPAPPTLMSSSSFAASQQSTGIEIGEQAISSSPPAPAPVLTSVQQQQFDHGMQMSQQCMPSVALSSTMPPPAQVPEIVQSSEPFEKEGNPFDFY